MVGWEVVSIEVVVVMCLQVGLAEASQMSLKWERLGKFVLTHTVQAQFDNKGLQKHRIHDNRHDVHNHCNRTVQRVCLCVTLGTNNLFILGKYQATTLASKKTLSLERCHSVLLPSPF